jgi:hypothetical protein
VNKKLFPLACASMVIVMTATSHAQSVDVKNSVVTVSKMMEIDAKQSEQKFLEEAIKAGVITPEKKEVSVSKAKPVALWNVRSIYGTGEQLSAEVSVDGLAHTVGKGSVVGSCRVATIKQQCLTIEPQKSSKGKPLGLCPRLACWTGEEMAAALRAQPPQNDKVPLPAALPAPLPVPIPQGSVSSPAPLPGKQ